MAELIYDLYPGDMNWTVLDGCAIYNSGYGVSGSPGTGELGGFVTNTGKAYLSIGTFNSSNYVVNREAKFTLNLANMEYMIIDCIAGNDFNGGERPNNFGESLYLQSVTGSGQTYTIAVSGQDGGYVFPDMGGQENWFTKTINFSEQDKLGTVVWRFYAYSVQQPEFAGEGGIYSSNVNAGDRYGISRIRVYGTVPTTISYFRGNDKNEEVSIYPGDPLTLTWNTKFGSFNTATSASINQGIGALSPITQGTYTLTSGPTEETTYTMSATGQTGTITKTLLVKMKQPDINPDTFAFDSLFGADLSTEYVSNTITIFGLQDGISIDLTATNGALTSKNGQTFSTSTKSVTNNDTVTVKMISSDSYNTPKQTTVSAGTASAVWKITTKSPAAQIPNTFTFNKVFNAPVLSYVESNEVTISGITTSVIVTAPTNGAESSVDGSSFSTSAKTITNGGKLKLRVFTSNTLGDTATTSISVGDGSSVNWEVVNVTVADGNPDYFDFTNKANQPSNSYVESNIITVTGINIPTNVTATNGAQIKINGTGSWLTNGTIENNETLQVRILSSSDPGGEVSTEITIGSLTDTWKVTTTTDGDTIPDDFFFIAADKQPFNTYCISNTVLITGITSTANVEVTGGECSINGGDWVTTGTVQNNDTLRVRVLTSSIPEDTKILSITVG